MVNTQNVGFEPQSLDCKAEIIPLCHHGINSNVSYFTNFVFTVFMSIGRYT